MSSRFVQILFVLIVSAATPYAQEGKEEKQVPASCEEVKAMLEQFSRVVSSAPDNDRILLITGNLGTGEDSVELNRHRLHDARQFLLTAIPGINPGRIMTDEARRLDGLARLTFSFRDLERELLIGRNKNLCLRKNNRFAPYIRKSKKELHREVAELRYLIRKLRSLKPLKATKSDIERVLGKGELTKDFLWIETKFGNIRVTLSDGTCTEDWLAPKDTLIELLFDFEELPHYAIPWKVRLDKLRSQSGYDDGMVYIFDDRRGIGYVQRYYSGKFVEVSFYPPKKFSNYRCD